MTKYSEPSAASLRAIPEVDFSRGVRGKYAGQLSNVVVIDRDLVGEFPDSKSVNDALRAVLALRKATTPLSARRKRRPARRRSSAKRPGT
jgi:hypothetical protein